MPEAALPHQPAMFLAKARENLAAGETLLGEAQLNACASRAYYAAFQAAVAALWVEGIRPPRDQGGTLSHSAVQGEWAGRRIYRRKLYDADLRRALLLLYDWRVAADYRAESISKRDAQAAVRLARRIVDAVSARLEAVS